MKKILLALLCVLLCASASAEPLHAFESDTLRYTVEQVQIEEVTCYVTKIWMAQPGRQIKKATAAWEEGLMLPSEMADRVEGAVLAVNGSGYVSPVFPEIPDNYPGSSPDYYYTPLGSLTVTDGELFRHLQGVPFYGLTLQQDGLHMHVGEDIETILPHEPTQTWSFYERCPMILDHQSILDPDWSFARARAMRTIIAKLSEEEYLLLTVTNRHRGGLNLFKCVDYLMAEHDPIWAYDLDGGPSSALLVRPGGEGEWITVFGNTSEDADIMAFVE